MYRSAIGAGYAPSGLQSPVSPSQQPNLNRQRGHCHVPWRHSMRAPQRGRISTGSRLGSALIPPTVARGEDGYDGRAAPWPRG